MHLSKKNLYFLRIFFRIWLFLIFILMVIPTGGNSHLDFSGRDKVIHFCLFALLGFFFVATRANLNGLFRLDIKNRSAILLLLFTFSIEFVQLLLPYRSFELLDILMNVLGLLSGALVGRVFMLRFFKV